MLQHKNKEIKIMENNMCDRSPKLEKVTYFLIISNKCSRMHHSYCLPIVLHSMSKIKEQK